MVQWKDKTFFALKKWNGGDSEGLDELLERHLSWILAHVRSRLGPALRSKVESGDFVQEAVIKFLKYAPRFQMSDDARFRALMIRIVENVLRDKRDWFSARRRTISKECQLPPETILDLDSPSRVARRNEREAWVRLGLDLIDSDEREVVLMRDFDGFTFAEIAERLGITYNQARNRYFRSIERLGKEIWALCRGDPAAGP